MMWSGIVREEREASLQKASPSYSLLPEQIHSFIPASMHPSADMYWTPVCRSCTRDSWCGDDYRTHRRETDLWTNPRHHTAQGQQEKMQGRAVRQASQWITHGRARTNQRRLPGGGNLCQGKNRPVSMSKTLRHGITGNAVWPQPSRDTAPSDAGWTGLYALLVGPSSGMLTS